MADSTQRFSTRVENYVKYRPGYPPEIIGLLERECGLNPDAVVADLGSGTGIFTQLLLENCRWVFAVEPNAEMRAAAERLLGHQPNFTSIAAAAEATTLPAQGVDLITAGQAFHWFDRTRARREFGRILKPGGWVVLLWNDRRTDSTAFLQAYEKLLLDCSIDYAAVNHKQVDAAAIGEFFAPGDFKSATFPNRQTFDFAGLAGRLLSSSYAPEPGHPKHDPMMRDLAALFAQYQQNGQVTFEYDTLVYYGRLPS